MAETEMAIAIAPVSVPDHRRLCAEAVSSAATSASCYERSEHVRIFAMIMAERELCEIERQILRAYLMEVSDYAAL
jgi:hypothetical protein